MASSSRLEAYRALAEELERLAAQTADERLRWQHEAMARAYRLAIAAARRQDAPAPT